MLLQLPGLPRRIEARDHKNKIYRDAECLHFDERPFHSAKLIAADAEIKTGKGFKGKPARSHAVLCERPYPDCDNAYECYVWSAHQTDDTLQIGQCIHNLGSIRTVYNMWYPVMTPPYEEMRGAFLPNEEIFGIEKDIWKGFVPRTLEGIQMEYGKIRHVGMASEGPKIKGLGDPPKRLMQRWSEKLAGYFKAFRSVFERL
jgi:hypothetical protein